MYLSMKVDVVVEKAMGSTPASGSTPVFLMVLWSWVRKQMRYSGMRMRDAEMIWESERRDEWYGEDEFARGSRVLDDRVRSVEERQLEKKDVLHELVMDLGVKRRMGIDKSAVLLEREQSQGNGTRRNSDRFTIATIS